MLFISASHLVVFQIQVVLFFLNNIRNCNSIIISGIALAFRHPSRKKAVHSSTLENSEAQKYELSLKVQVSLTSSLVLAKG